MLLEVRTVAILGMLVTKREPCGRAGGGQATRATFCFFKKNIDLAALGLSCSMWYL